MGPDGAHLARLPSPSLRQLLAREAQLAENERLIAARAESLEEALELAQLLTANQRADRLEEALRTREVEDERWLC